MVRCDGAVRSCRAAFERVVVLASADRMDFLVPARWFLENEAPRSRPMGGLRRGVLLPLLGNRRYRRLRSCIGTAHYSALQSASHVQRTAFPRVGASVLSDQ